MLLHQFPMPECPYEEGFLPFVQNTRGTRKPSRCTGYFSCLDLKSGFWQIKMDKALKQYTAFTVGYPGNSLSVIECLLDSVMHWLLSNGLCRIVWVS